MLCDSGTIVSEELVRNSILLREAAWSGYQLGVHCSMWQLLYIVFLSPGVVFQGQQRWGRRDSEGTEEASLESSRIKLSSRDLHNSETR